MTLLPNPPGDPLLPYAGTSGYSGTDTSEDRARRDDDDGTTAGRQALTVSWLASMGMVGSTWKELARAHGWHHGQASGVLSVLHKTGVICRLADRRGRCKIYVLPEYVDGLETEPHGRTPGEDPATIAAVLRRLDRLDVSHGGTVDYDDVLAAVRGGRA